MSDTETCHVVVLGFDPQLDPPAVRLQRVFGLDVATCEALLENLPATVQRSVPRVRAEYFRRALLSIGAQVEVRSPAGELIEAPPPAPAPALAPAPAPAPAAAPVVPSASGAALSLPPLSATPTAFEAPLERRVPALGLHAAATEPLPQLVQPQSGWAAEPSPWAVDATSRTLAQQQPASAGLPASVPTAEPEPVPSGVEPAFNAWNAASPWSGAPPARAAEPTAFVGPPPGMSVPSAPHSQQTAAWVTAGAPAPGPSAPTLIEPRAPQPELRAPASPTLREGAAPAPGPAVPARVAPVSGPARAAPAFGDTPFAASPTAHAVPAPGPWAPAPAAGPPAYAPAPGAPQGYPPPSAPLGPASNPSPWGAGLDLASLRPPAQQAAPFVLPQAPAPAPASASSGGLGSRLPSDIWDAPVADGPGAGLRSPSEVHDPKAAERASVPAPRVSAPLPGARPSVRPPGLRSSAPPPPAALEHALRSTPPPAAAGETGGGFQVIHNWEQLREEFSPDGPRPRARAAAPPVGAGPSAAPRPRPAPGAAATPTPTAVVATPRPKARSASASFWESFGDALALPFSGSGLYWIAAISVWSVVASVLGMLANVTPLVGAVVTFCLQTSLLALACDYARATFWAPAVGERELERGPDFSPAHVLSDYFGRGLLLSFFVLLSQVAGIAWVAMSVFDGTPPADLLLDPVTWLLFFFPYCYWPMGVALTALRNDFGGVWQVLVGVRAIARAPFEYLAVVLVGFAVLAASVVTLFLVGSSLGLSGAILTGTLGLPLALSHGIQGALLGHLARARAEIFED